MNAKTLTAALTFALAAGTAFSAHAVRIVDLPAVKVRPSAEQLAEVAANRPIVTLPAVKVRPSAAQLAELAHEARPVVTLAAVKVYPTAQQRAEYVAGVVRTQLSGLARQQAQSAADEALAVAAQLASTTAATAGGL